jgi:hypothetical protein
MGKVAHKLGLLPYIGKHSTRCENSPNLVTLSKSLDNNDGSNRIDTNILQRLHMYKRICMHVCTYVRMYVYLPTNVCTYVCIPTYLCIYLPMYIPTHVCMYLCMYSACYSRQLRNMDAYKNGDVQSWDLQMKRLVWFAWDSDNSVDGSNLFATKHGNVSFKKNWWIHFSQIRTNNTMHTFCILNHHPMPWRDSISRPITPQAETIPLDHVARPNIHVHSMCSRSVEGCPWSNTKIKSKM